MATITLTVGLTHWANLRSIAAEHGLRVSEGRGWLKRDFTLTGDHDTVERLRETIHDLLENASPPVL